MPRRYLIAFNRSRGLELAGKVVKADAFWPRLKGLLGRRSMEPGSGLWIVPCPQIHTFFMGFSIDVLFLDKDRKVLRILEDFRPWRLSPWIAGSRSVLELPAGSLAGKAGEGDEIEFK